MSENRKLHGVATINIFTADHAAAQKWYTELLGVEPYFARPGYVEFRFGDYLQELGIIDSKYAPGNYQADSPPAGAILYWHVDDLDAALLDLLARGATLLEGRKERGAGFITASVVDPFGNILGIMYNPHYLEVLGAMRKM